MSRITSWKQNPFGIEVVFTTDYETAKKLTGESSPAKNGNAGWCVEILSRVILVYVNLKPSDNSDPIATLVHELFHAVNFIAKLSGFDMADSDGEVGAYLQDNMFSKFKPVIDKALAVETAKLLTLVHPA